MIDTLAPFNLINHVDPDISRLWAHLELSDVGKINLFPDICTLHVKF